MKDPWFRKDGPMHWVPASPQGWLVLLLWVILGPVLGEILIFFKGPTPISTLAGTAWLCASIFALLYIVTHNDDTLSS